VTTPTTSHHRNIDRAPRRRCARRSRYGIIAAALLLFAGPAPAAAPAPVALTPAPPSVSAGSYILLDFNSGDVLVENNARTRMEPASLTKLMTAYIVFNDSSLASPRQRWLYLKHNPDNERKRKI